MLKRDSYFGDLQMSGFVAMFYNINFLMKNLEGMWKVTNFALAFEKHPTEGAWKPGRRRPSGRRRKKINKFFLRKVWKLWEKVLNFATLFARISTRAAGRQKRTLKAFTIDK